MVMVFEARIIVHEAIKLLQFSVLFLSLRIAHCTVNV